ncbi:C40 family peptidase [Corynebacterium sp. TAE3-ERU2]|uniref:C40 family peptidase n=1 Tax=Corynebacterium sp. TAE3-ERU2 TaxID=2849497 RepID=UPI00351CF86C
MEKFQMGNHNRRSASRIVRNAAAATAVAAGASAALATPAQALDINVPVVGNVSVPGVPNVPSVPAVPNIPGVPAEINNIVDTGQLSSQLPVQIPGQAQVARSVAPASSNSVGDRIVSIARSKTGAPYVWGAAGPDAFDCSGFTSWVYSQVGKSIPRTSQQQAAAGVRVPLSQIRPGDIVAYYGGASHVGIYVGNGTIIDAMQSGTPVGERPLDYMPIHSVVRF